MGVLREINTLNANSNVGTVVISFDDRNEWNDDILKLVISRYSNIYDISVSDYNNYVDDIKYRIIKQWV